ncbi:helix-hairpin-helix domain-containing protein [Streptacidiphilus sp. PB12-B1b]|uniref:ComEA family DNA-binding protein n=1 Tax=Streptacidiphilus sp. PB12-B1b TaxID=2705012 RepID=UPI0015FC5141|nr:helix-hairpin-helix domain-containing protein [Streptacidiphilus sp. PB12-B1b]QMU77449.1 helix-hairpin-helix domain-containing protein [Streptacidiphilus sp. PB12-B1b]
MAKADGAGPPAGALSPWGSVLWALLPLLTIGLGTVFVLGWAAQRLRSRLLAAGTGLSLALTVSALVLLNAPNGSTAGGVGGALILLLIGGGLASTFTVRGRLVRPGYPGLTAAADATGAPARSGSVDPAVAAALERRGRRNQARALLQRDPALARELRVGRPDLPRSFDDGGLVDVNHVPAETLAALPGVTAELAARIVRVRAERGGFALAEELAVCADVPEPLLADLSERLLYLP